MARLFDDGSNEYLELASAIMTVTPLSMACWFYSDDDTVTQALMGIGDGDAGTYDGFLIVADGAFAGDPLDAIVLVNQTPFTAVSSVGYSTNTWHHACGVFASSTSRTIYLDGGNSGTEVTLATPAGVDTTAIGRLPGFAAWEVSGRVAEAAMWNVALTAADAVVLAAGYSPLFVRPQNLVAYWSLIRDEDQDRVGGFDMTAFNTPSIAPHVPIRYPSAKMAGVSVGAPLIVAPFLTTYGGYSIPVGV